VAHLSIVVAALAIGHWLAHQTGRSIKKFVRTARRAATAPSTSRAARTSSPPPTRYPNDLRDALLKIRADSAH
jgi:hypothetical protein